MRNLNEEKIFNIDLGRYIDHPTELEEYSDEAFSESMKVWFTLFLISHLNYHRHFRRITMIHQQFIRIKDLISQNLKYEKNIN